MKLFATSILSILLVFISVATAESNSLPNNKQPTAVHLPSLTDWTKAGISDIFQAKNEADFTNTVNDFLSEKVQIEFNGGNLSRANFITLIKAARANGTGATLTFFNSVEAPSDQNNPTAAGSVGLFFDTTITKNIVHGGTKVVSSDIAAVNFVIAPDSDIHPTTSPSGGAPDSRRVMVLNRVSPPPTQNP